MSGTPEWAHTHTQPTPRVRLVTYEFTAYYAHLRGGSELPVVVTADTFVHACELFATWRENKRTNPTQSALISDQPVRVTRDTGNDLTRPGHSDPIPSAFSVGE